MKFAAPVLDPLGAVLFAAAASARVRALGERGAGVLLAIGACLAGLGACKQLDPLVLEEGQSPEPGRALVVFLVERDGELLSSGSRNIVLADHGRGVILRALPLEAGEYQFVSLPPGRYGIVEYRESYTTPTLLRRVGKRSVRLDFHVDEGDRALYLGDVRLEVEPDPPEVTVATQLALARDRVERRHPTLAPHLVERLFQEVKR